jgi:hypothetical protein
LRAAHYIAHLPNLISRHCIIPNYPSKFIVGEKPLAVEPELTEFLNRYKIVGIYSGLLRVETESVRVFFEVLRKFEDVGIVLVGRMSGEFDVPKNVLFLGQISHEGAIWIQGKCDFAVALYENSPLNTCFCAPTKIYEYLNASLPVVVNSNFSLKQLGNSRISFFSGVGDLCDIFTELLLGNVTPEKDIPASGEFIENQFFKILTLILSNADM